MEPSSKHIRKNRRFSSKAFKRAAKIGSSVILLGIVSSVVISVHTNNIIGKLIQELIKLRTDGTYNIHYEELDYSFTDNVLKIKNLQLSVDTTSANFIGLINTGGEVAFSANAPYMYLDIVDIWSVYFDKELRINGVKFEDPTLNIQNYKEDRGIVWQKDAGSLYDIISEHLEVFRVNQMEVKNGRFHFEKMKGVKRRYSIENISFSIKNFLLDSESKLNRDKFFYTDDIDLELVDQRINLKDSIHTLYFKKLVLSTTKSEISVDSLIVSENPNHPSAGQSHDFYSIYVPSINIRNIDFKSAYNDEVLNIGKLNIFFPKISITDFPRDEVRDSAKSSLGSLVLDYFSNIAVDSFNLSNASLGYQFKSKTRSQGFKLDNLNMKLTEFKLDSSNLNSQRPLFYETLEFDIKDYQFNLPDSIHIFSFSNLVGSTSNRHLTFEDLRIRPRTDADLKKLLAKNKKNKTIDIFFPEAVFHNVEGQDFFNTDTLRIEKIEAKNPEIQLWEYPGFSSGNDFSDSLIFDFYPLLKNFAKAIYIQQGSFSQGNFSWFIKEQKLVPQYLVQNFDLVFDKINIDSVSAGARKLLAAENIDFFSEQLILEGFQNKFRFYGNNLHYSGLNKNLSAENIDLTLLKEDPSEIADNINVAGLVCRGIDLNQIFNGKKSNISYLKIIDPNIKVFRIGNNAESTSRKSPLLPALQDLEIKKFSIENGNFDIKLSNKRNFEAKNVFFEFDNFKSKSSADKKFSVGNYHLRLNNLTFAGSTGRLLTAKRLNYDPKDSSTVLNDLVYHSGESKSHFQHIKAPEVIITQWRPLNLYFHNEISPEIIQLNNPDFTIIRGSKEAKAERKKSGRLIDKIDAARLVITNGTVNYRKAKDDDSLFYKTDNVDLTLYNFKMDSTSSEDVFSLENIETRLHNNLITFHNSPDTIFIELINKNETGSSFELENLVYKKHDEDTREMAFQTAILKAEIKGFDFAKLNEKIIEIEDVYIVKPEVSYNDRDSKEDMELRELVFLKQLDLGTRGFNRVRINSIALDSGKVDLLLKKNEHSKTWNFDALDIKILSFDTDKKNKIFNSDGVKVSFEGIEYDLPDSLNLIKTGRITLSLSDSSLMVDGLSLVPRVGKHDYADIKGTQTDWLKINTGELILSRVNFEKLLTREGIVAQKFEINDLNIYAFRDKRIPINEQIYKPLPQELLKGLNVLINIDTTVLKNGNIRYEEFALEAIEAGNIEFTNLNATALNICNDEAILKRKPRCTLTADALMMGEGRLSATFSFDMLSPENYFNLDVSLEAMDLQHFNEIMEPIAFVTIKKGKNNKLNMTALANEDVAIGSMYFQYEDLKISLINKNTYDTKGTGPVIGSFFANTFIINRKNPRLLTMNEGEIYFERDKYKSIFNYWSKIFFSGIVSSIGAKSNKKEIRKYEKMEEDEISRTGN